MDRELPASEIFHQSSPLQSWVPSRGERNPADGGDGAACAFWAQHSRLVLGLDYVCPPQHPPGDSWEHKVVAPSPEPSRPSQPGLWAGSVR